MVSLNSSVPPSSLAYDASLQQNNDDDESGSFDKINASIITHQRTAVLSQTAATATSEASGNINHNNKTRCCADPSKHPDKESKIPPEEYRRRQKPRLQSGPAVQAITNMRDLQQHHALKVPILIRDKSFRVIRQNTLERKLCQLPQFHNSDMQI